MYLFEFLLFFEIWMYPAYRIRIGSKPISEIIFFRGIGRKVGRSLTRLILGMPVCPWFGLARRRRSSESKLSANFDKQEREREREREIERERERERETSACCIIISCYLEKNYVSVLKMILRDASRAHQLLQVDSIDALHAFNACPNV